MPTSFDAEHGRLREDSTRESNWKRWGPYLAERQWGTVREDYSDSGDCWTYFPHDHARSRAYRWGEDGLLGFTDRECRLCFSLSLWNEKDSILKERLFGLTGPEGNHGEDVKELYYYLDSTPTHSYFKSLYKYPQNEYPYQQLIEENRSRSKEEREYELLDTKLFDNNEYFDISAEYAKNSPDDILIRIKIENRSSNDAPLHIIPTLFFRNTWSWGCKHEGCTMRPNIEQKDNENFLRTKHDTLEPFLFDINSDENQQMPEVLFTENETNVKRLYNVDNPKPYVKDAFNEYIINKRKDLVNPKRRGTKVGLYYRLNVKAKSSATIRLRLYRLLDDGKIPAKLDFKSIDEIIEKRINETNEFYSSTINSKLNKDERNIVRQAYAGLLHSKQFYHYIIDEWIDGDSDIMSASDARKKNIRNKDWLHLYCRDIISMPDKWEYPWFASWDLAFHVVPFAHIDPHFAKTQLRLFLREWYMHPNGQIPAYEFNFGDVNPPVGAWAAWRIYKMSTDKKEERDRSFLESVFLKYLMNFTWWVNRKDPDNQNLFAGGFLGLDNIGVFDRSAKLPEGGTMHQSDGTSWMCFYSLTMFAIAIELAGGVNGSPVIEAYEDMASKFFEHFVQIVDAMNVHGGTGLWDEEDGFYYDQVKCGKTDEITILKSRSLVGVMPLIAVSVLEVERIESLPGFKKRLEWFLKYKPSLRQHMTHRKSTKHDSSEAYLLAIPSEDRLRRMLAYILDENEFLSEYGLRSLSKYHDKHPYVFHGCHQEDQCVSYSPGESKTGMFGGNSNWRGPIWLCINYLVIEALERYHRSYGDDWKIECPTGSGKLMNLKEVSQELARRLVKIFLLDENGKRPCNGDDKIYETDPNFRDLLLFYEYFHGCTGRGLGASHQTGWTALIIQHIEDIAKLRKD
ncbi:unnamed protein product [Adineta steineri]|uniref:Mannosylglycerate hydrolase MGH1-like glycoside hydrolase domain-containing protein n=1 Tax=Adineta steineri TaxID=433720 RepID=A0A814XBE5_9BILA|nr:unnamed protein product [Adineta steineri]